MAEFHGTAVVDAAARLGAGVRIGPYSVVGPEVDLGDQVVLHSHVVVTGRTRVGARTQFFPFASIGHRPQDLKYQGEASNLVIGEDCIIREHVTINPGTRGGGMTTRVGSNCLFMMAAHVAHDCQIGDRVIMANNATLGGHVVVETGAIIGGLSAIHQFVRIGRHAMVGGMSGVEQDVIPYGMVAGDRARLQGLNVIGLKRHGFDRNDIRALTKAYKIIFSAEDTLSVRVGRAADALGENAAVADILDFIRGESARPLCQPGADRGV